MNFKEAMNLVDTPGPAWNKVRRSGWPQGVYLQRAKGWGSTWRVMLCIKHTMLQMEWQPYFNDMAAIDWEEGDGVAAAGEE